ncbi:hypothetical protein STCU_07479 [Strigomonas culicis]|uniref:Uncharacterized protein n=1 Tax=Strigomonas culicis TaxID=28005 RepID=S9V9V1_9TRYP|nr:hypothetical protein STCU_07479 [Strigomonas culicis]|eukprot:EPY23761.1 hypothetical protein STCU_07479 [Strigomonas culicis]
MRVATMYQRGIRWSLMTIGALIMLLLASIYTDVCVYVWLKLCQRTPREEVLAWFRRVTLRHVTTEVPAAYQHLLPPPCALYKDATGETNVAVNIVELVHAEKKVTVLAIPCPQMGERRFYDQVGELVRECDSVMLEAVTFEKIDKTVPAYFLPLKEDTFPALGVHHRYLDLLRHTQREPPKLYPAGSACGWKAYIQQILIPFEIRCVYVPDVLSATKAEARVGWGRLRDVVDRLAMEQAEADPGSPPLIIALPWTVLHVVNLEASLVKYGFKVRKVFPSALAGRESDRQPFLQLLQLLRWEPHPSPPLEVPCYRHRHRRTYVHADPGARRWVRAVRTCSCV